MRAGITRVLPLDALKILEPHFESVDLYERGRPLNQVELAEAISDKDVFICQLTEPINEFVLSRAHRLKHLVTFSTGVDHLDLKALKIRGVKISHTPGVLTEATANLAWALILNCGRRVNQAREFLRQGRFNGFFPSLFLGLSFERATLGIVGMGKIGEAVAKRAQCFGMRVVYVSRRSQSVVGATQVGFEELLKESDVVSLHCPLTLETRHLFNQESLSKMKLSAILINTARGPIIDETALVEHLKKNPEFQAGLDVFEKEPQVTQGLLELPNALCVPHIGSASRCAREEMARICIEEAMRFARGENLQYEYPL